MGRFDDLRYVEEVNKELNSKPKKLAEMTPEVYQKSIEAVKSGKVTIEQIKAKYELSETREKALKELIKL